MLLLRGWGATERHGEKNGEIEIIWSHMLDPAAWIGNGRGADGSLLCSSGFHWFVWGTLM